MTEKISTEVTVSIWKYINGHVRLKKGEQGKKLMCYFFFVETHIYKTKMGEEKGKEKN